MNRVEIKRKAKFVVNENFKNLFTVNILLWILTIIFGYFVYNSNKRLVSLLEIIIIMPLYVGYIKYLFNINNCIFDINVLFSGYKKMLVIFLTSIISIIIVLCGYILLIIPGIVLQVSLSYIYIIIADSDELNCLNIIKKSFDISKNHICDMMLFYLSFIPWIIVCVLTFGLAEIYVIPYIQLSIIYMYKELKKKSI